MSSMTGWGLAGSPFEGSSEIVNGGATGRKGIAIGPVGGRASSRIGRSRRRALILAVALALMALFIAVGAGPALASEGYWQVLSSGTSQDLHSVFFIDQNTGWAVGNAGVILATTTGGLTWQSQTSGTTGALLSVAFADAKNGWAVGTTSDSGPVILHTSDGGATWAPQTSPGATALRSITVIDKNTAWACGDSAGIIKTADAGTTWVKQDSGMVASSSVTLDSIKFVDKTYGFTGGTYHVRVTTDGGQTWLEGGNINTLGENWGLYGADSLSFTDKDNGWLIGNASIIGTNPVQYVHFLLRTTTGGRSWQKKTVGSSGNPRVVDFIDQDNGWIIGDAGLILHTSNGGVTWVVQTSGTTNDLSGVSLSDKDHGFAVGQAGTIVKYRVGTGPPPIPGGTPIFVDVPATATYFSAIQGLGQAGVVEGYQVGANQEFRPANILLRAQFVKMALGVLQVPVSDADWTGSKVPFTDLGPKVAGKLYPHDYIAVAYNIGMAQGKTATTFAPFQNITRLQLISMVVRAGRLFSPNSLPDPPADWTGVLTAYYSDPDHGANVRIAEYNHLLDGLSGFGSTWNATNPATRGEAAQILWNLYNVVGTLPAAPGKRILFADDFSNSASGWPTYGDQTSAIGYDSSLQDYVISINQAPLGTWAARSPNYTDFTAEVDGQIANSLDGTYGLVFRLADNNNYYEFALSKDGHCQLWKRVSGTRQDLTPAIDATSVFNASGWNHLRVTCQGSAITLFVNGFQMGNPITDSTLGSGKIGLIGEAITSGGVQFRFDNFKLWSAP